MSLDRAILWLQLVGTIGIIGGLVMVGLQLNQSSEIAQREHISHLRAQNNSQAISIMGEDAASAWARATFSPKEITARELVVVWAMLDYWSDLHDSMYEGGDALEGMFRWHARNYYGANPVARAWWNKNRAPGDPVPVGDTGWNRFVDAELSNPTPSELQLMYIAFCRDLPEAELCTTLDSAKSPRE